MPVLTSPLALVTSSTSAICRVNTNTLSNGLIYCIVSTNATPPSVAQIQAGQDSTGAAAVFATNAAPSTVSTKSFTATGLIVNTQYYCYFQHKDNTNIDSTVVGTGAFLTPISTIASGDFNNPSTWNTNTVPNSGQIFLISPTYTVTVTTPIVSAGGVVESLTGLYVASKLTMNGNLILGNGTGKDGQLALSSNGELELLADMHCNNCRVISTATSNAWAKITGTGNITYGSLYSSGNAKQDFGGTDGMKYVSFQNTGNITMRLANSYGAVTSRVKMSNCSLVGCGNITIGSSTYTLQTTNMAINYCDIRDVGHITYYSMGTTGLTAGLREFKYNTWSQSHSKDIRALVNRSKAILDMTGTVMDRASHKGNSIASSDSFIVQDVFCGSNMVTDDFTNGFGITQSPTGGAASWVRDSYFYVPPSAINPHFCGIVNSSPDDYSDNVFEISGSGANNLLLGSSVGPHTSYIQRNLQIGSASFVATTTPNVNPGTYIIRNNTHFTDNTDEHKGLLLIETNTYNGPLEFYDNIHYVNSGTTYHSFAIGGGAPAQSIEYSDYNLFYNMGDSTPYIDNMTVLSGSTHDKVNTINPEFTDPTRKFSEYGKVIGIDITYEAVVDKLLTRNGYNSTTKTQSSTPTTLVIADIIRWVRAGFVPKNVALQGAGRYGGDIGAMPITSGYITHKVNIVAGGYGTSSGGGSGVGISHRVNMVAGCSRSISGGLTAIQEVNLELYARQNVNATCALSHRVNIVAGATYEQNIIKGIKFTLAGTTNFTGARVLWWAAPLPLGIPSRQYLTFDSLTGEIKINISDTTLRVGEYGFILIYKPDLEDHRKSKIFAGRIQITNIA